MKHRFQATRVRDCAIGLVAAFTVFSCVASERDVPRFNDFQAKDVSTTKLVAVDVKSHPQAQRFKDRLTEAVGKSANFAGHYVVTTWGCGTSCQTVALIEVKSGRVFFAPFSTSLGSSFRVDSNLFVDGPVEAIREYYGGNLDVPNRLFFSRYYIWDEKQTDFRLVYEETGGK